MHRNSVAESPSAAVLMVRTEPNYVPPHRMWFRQAGGGRNPEVPARIAGCGNRVRSEATGGRTYTSAWAVRTLVHGAQCTALPSQPGDRRRVSGRRRHHLRHGRGAGLRPGHCGPVSEAFGYHHRTTGCCAPAPPAPCAGAVASSPLGPRFPVSRDQPWREDDKHQYRPNGLLLWDGRAPRSRSVERMPAKARTRAAYHDGLGSFRSATLAGHW
ncbi:hypothetical protein SAMN04490239_1521 [Rhodococcus koreensis]|uniref:Uncharacterized protein n=1 Tax=Rhodococcus koreensis TaxID=99653 RepID=A0A1H4LYB2_9NOCA|nr:hypothetical protein SAMN04490239_1521 [Rhodococcus koreensis]